MEQYYKIGLVFCRGNTSLATPPSLKELSAARVSDKMATAENSVGVSSFCRGGKCKHAAKQCKHWHSQSISTSAAGEHEGKVKRDNGLNPPDIS